MFKLYVNKPGTDCKTKVRIRHKDEEKKNWQENRLPNEISISRTIDFTGPRSHNTFLQSIQKTEKHLGYKSLANFSCQKVIEEQLLAIV